MRSKLVVLAVLIAIAMFLGCKNKRRATPAPQAAPATANEPTADAEPSEPWEDDNYTAESPDNSAAVAEASEELNADESVAEESPTDSPSADEPGDDGPVYDDYSGWEDGGYEEDE